MQKSYIITTNRSNCVLKILLGKIFILKSGNGIFEVLLIAKQIKISFFQTVMR